MKRVLVVDDEPLVCETLAALLQGEGYEAVIAGNGLDAITAAENARIDLAIVDIMMPGVDGLEAVKAIARIKPRVPVVAMSGRMLPEPADEFDTVRILATRLGAAYCLPKPFSLPDVRAAVEACLGSARRPG